MMKKRLGELLVDAGFLDEMQLQSALAHQRQWGGRLGHAIVHMGFLTEERLTKSLSGHLNVPIADPPPDDLHPRVLGGIPAELAARHGVFPLGLRRDARGEHLIIAMSDPTNIEAIDEVQFLTGRRVVVTLAGESQIETWCRRHYHGERQVPEQHWTNADGAHAQSMVQFSGQEVELAVDDDDIPVITGAIVGDASLTPGASLPAPFAAPTPFSLLETPTLAAAPFAAAPFAAAPFAAAPFAPAGVVASQATGSPSGFAMLDPLPPGPADGGWSSQVEARLKAPTAPSAAPVFGPSGGFLGQEDDSEQELGAPAWPPVPPVAAAPPSPFTSSSPFSPTSGPPSFGLAPTPLMAPVASGHLSSSNFSAPATVDVAPSSAEDMPVMELDELEMVEPEPEPEPEPMSEPVVKQEPPAPVSVPTPVEPPSALDPEIAPTAEPTIEPAVEPTVSQKPALSSMREAPAQTRVKSAASADSGKATGSVQQRSEPTTLPLTPAHVDPNYLHRPNPVYPALSKRLREEGTVLLRVNLDAQGIVLDISIEKSSSFQRLDQAAHEAVKQWRFIPAKRGQEAMPSTALVPIEFKQQ